MIDLTWPISQIALVYVRNFYFAWFKVLGWGFKYGKIHCSYFEFKIFLTLFSNRVTFIRTIEFRIYADLFENFKMLSKLGNFIRLILNLPITRSKIKTLVLVNAKVHQFHRSLVSFCLCIWCVRGGGSNRGWYVVQFPDYHIIR